MNFLCLRPKNLETVLKTIKWTNHSLVSQSDQQLRYFNANRTAVSKISRTKYCRLYRVLVVYPDGSTVTVRHPEPQSIIELPKLLDDCKTETERKEWLSRRKRVEKIVTEDEADIKYNQNQYLHLFRNKSKSRSQ